MKRIINELEKELKEREKKYNEHLTFIDIFVLSISTGVVVLKILNDSQTYFYSNYAFISLLSSISMCIILCYLLIRIIKLTRWSYFALVILVVTINFWVIPKILHYTILSSEPMCIESTLTHKYWHRYGDAGYIEFKPKSYSSIPKELLYFNSLSKISKYDYDLLPPKGSEIKICGDITMVGYTYSYTETIK